MKSPGEHERATKGAQRQKEGNKNVFTTKRSMEFHDI